MDAVVQITFITLNLLVVSMAFGLIGKEPESPSKYKATGQTAFIYGVFTIAFLIWWDTPDMVSLIAKIALIALLWLPWIYDLADIHKTQEPLTLKQVTIGTLLTSARIGIVLGFWVLY